MSDEAASVPRTNQEFAKQMDRVGGMVHPCEFALPEGGTLFLPGISIRSWFAGQAFSTLIADADDLSHALSPEDGGSIIRCAARLSVKSADALIAELAKVSP